jgi:prefoldin beta subunit
VIAQKQQLEIELAEIERALSELERSPDEAVIYKSVGSIMVKAAKQGVIEELKERKDIVNTRATVLARQETRSREKIDELQKKVQEMLRR